MRADYSEWDQYYRKYPLEELGWELGKPRPILVEYLEQGLIPKGKALDICCGVGTNAIYLAQNGFDIIGIDVSITAIEMAKRKARQVNVNANFLAESFIDLSFRNEEFIFVFDMGCFHHVNIADRAIFIKEVHDVLKENGVYMLTCFSYMNGQRWNHFTQKQLMDLFSVYFKMGEFRHYSSLEGDGVTRFFYTVLMKKR